MTQDQQQMLTSTPSIPVQDDQRISDEERRLITLFTEMDNKQLDFLDESGKSLIERISTFLAVLFGVTVLGNFYPQPYLKPLPVKVLAVAVLICYITAIFSAVLVIQPRMYRRYLHNISRLSRELERITRYKILWLRVAGVFFVLGSVALAVLIVSIIWQV